MRVMALDYGTRRTGVAVCDHLEITVRPVETIRGASRQGALQRVAELVEELEAELIVVGLPLNMDGSEGPAATRVRQFVAQLAALVQVPIEFRDERLTSYEADLMLREQGFTQRDRQAKSDEWAAMILLQDYLSSRSSNQNSPGNR